MSSTTQDPTLLESIHETMEGLYQAGLVSQATMREIDSLCLPPIPDLSAADIKEIRGQAGVSQGVMAKYLGVAKSTVSQWEQGVKHPQGPALRLLDLIRRKGLEALI